ncbi:MAG: phytoene desaturase family protein, partial [Gammaproteobacteria bacterium]
MMTEKYDVAVIGAGHNGLICAAYLAKAGRKVIVLEAAERIGGAAVTREFAAGFSVSACAHLLYMLHSGIVSELELERHGLELAARNLSTVALSPQGRHVTLSPRRVEGDELSATDRSGYPAFMNRLRRFARVLEGAYQKRPPRLASGDWREH